MSNKIRIGVLGSTRGTDLQAVIDSIEKKELNVEIAIVISNKKDAFILERAKNHGIKTLFLDKNDFSPKKEFDKELANKLVEEKVNLILLIGYMRLLTEDFCNMFKNKIMNIHPSLLPKFAGGMDKDVHQEVLDAKEKITGCTLHFVDESVDAGPIIMQKEVKIEKDETVDSLKEKVQKAEQKIILKAIKLFSEGKIKVEGNKVIIFGDENGLQTKYCLVKVGQLNINFYN